METEEFYIGVHTTKDINDSYMGSGVNITKALSQYPASSFKKDILFVFNDRESAFKKEKELVNKKTIKNVKCLNICIGGDRVIDFKWTFNLLKEEALKFESVRDWREQSVSSYVIATRKNWVKILSTHMEREWRWWTKEEVIIAAKDFSSVKDWKEGCNGSYQQAHKMGIYDSILKSSNMEGGRPKISNEDIIQEAKKYSNTLDYKKNSPYYNRAGNREIYQECVAHMTKGTSWGEGRFKFSDEEVLEEAKNYETTKDFRKSPHYHLIKSRGLYHQAVKHMRKLKGSERLKVLLPDEEIIREAKNYESVKLYRKNSPHYHKCRSRGIYYECTAHMSRAVVRLKPDVELLFSACGS